MISRTVAVAALFLAVVAANENRFPGAAIPGPLASSAAPAQDWAEFKYPERGFAARFPVAPTPQEQVLGEEGHKYTQYMYIAEQEDHAYMLCVFEYQPNVVPSVPDDDYFTNLINAYVGGSKTTLRKKYPKTIAGHNGMEAIADDASGTHTHVVGVIAVGNRLYLTVSLGPTGHETSAEATRFRDSLRLL